MTRYLRQPLLLTLSIVLLLAVAACSGDRRLQHLGPGAVVLAFGDSITYGTGASHNASYPVVLEQLIGHKVVNAGIPGEVSTQGLARLPEVLDEAEPDLIILCLGGNDILRKQSRQALAENLRQMIQIARDRHIDVVLLGVPEFNLFNHSSLPLYEEVAKEFDIPYDGDVIPDIEFDRSLKSDPIHPNAEGYRLIAEAVQELLEDNGAL